MGNVVAANQTTALTTIRQLDPIYVSLTELSTNLLRLRDALASGTVRGEGADVAFRLILENGKEYAQKGKLDMSKQIVSETTGTFIIRVLFPNPDLCHFAGHVCARDRRTWRRGRLCAAATRHQPRRRPGV